MTKFYQIWSHHHYIIIIWLNFQNRFAPYNKSLNERFPDSGAPKIIPPDNVDDGVPDLRRHVEESQVADARDQRTVNQDPESI